MQNKFHEFNRLYFSGKLPRYRIIVTKRLEGGYCDSKKRTILLGPSKEDGVLIHEMAHASLEPYGGHGVPFKKEMKRLKRLGAPIADNEFELLEGPALPIGCLYEQFHDAGWQQPDILWSVARKRCPTAPEYFSAAKKNS